MRRRSSSDAGWPSFSTGNATATDPATYLHLYLVNRGVLLTPFHNMSLICPATSLSDVERHHEAIDGCLDELLRT